MSDGYSARGEGMHGWGRGGLVGLFDCNYMYSFAFRICIRSLFFVFLVLFLLQPICLIAFLNILLLVRSKAERITRIRATTTLYYYYYYYYYY